MKSISLKLQENLHILIFLALAFLYVFYPFHFEEGGISADAVFDAQIARNILMGEGLGWQATLQPPLQAIMSAAIFPLAKNVMVSGVLVSKLMWWLLPVPVYILTKEFFGTKTALISSILVFFHPHFGFASGMMEPTVTYATLLAFGVCFVRLAFSRESMIYSILGGLFFSLAYLARSEGFFIFLFSISIMSAISIKDYLSRKVHYRQYLIPVMLVASFFAASAPYIVFLHGTYGKVVLSPKSSYVQTWMKSRIYHDNDLGEQGNPELWGLSNNGKLMWQEPKGMGDLVGYLMSHPGKSLSVYIHNFGMQLPGRIPNNSGQWLYPQTYPLYFVVPALLWLIFSFRDIESRRKNLYLISPFAILFILPVFTEGWWKYLLPYSPFLIILAVAGASQLCEKFKWRFLLPAVAIIIVIYSFWTVKASPLVKPDIEVRARLSVAEEQKKAGIWAQNRFKGAPNYMVQWTKLAYYLNGRWTAMPVTDDNGMVWYAKKNKVDYMVFEIMGSTELNELVSFFRATPDMELADIYQSPTSNYGIVFFKLRR